MAYLVYVFLICHFVPQLVVFIFYFLGALFYQLVFFWQLAHRPVLIIEADDDAQFQCFVYVETAPVRIT